MTNEAEKQSASVNENEEKAIPKDTDHEDPVRTLPHLHSIGFAGYTWLGAVMSPEHARRGCEAEASEPAGRVVARVGAAAPGLVTMRRADREAKRLAQRVGVAAPSLALHTVIDAINGIAASTTKKNADGVNALTKLLALDEVVRHPPSVGREIGGCA